MQTCKWMRIHKQFPQLFYFSTYCDDSDEDCANVTKQINCISFAVQSMPEHWPVNNDWQPQNPIGIGLTKTLETSQACTIVGEQCIGRPKYAALTKCSPVDRINSVNHKQHKKLWIVEYENSIIFKIFSPSIDARKVGNTCKQCQISLVGWCDVQDWPHSKSRSQKSLMA